MIQKDPLHDIRSSFSAIQLGVKMLSQMPEIEALNSDEVSKTLRQIIEKTNEGLEQTKVLERGEDDS